MGLRQPCGLTTAVTIEATVGRLKDFRRVATRYDKLAVNFLSAVILATLVAFYL